MNDRFENAVIENKDREEFERLLTSFTDKGFKLSAYSTAALASGQVHYSAVMQRLLSLVEANRIIPSKSHGTHT